MRKALFLLAFGLYQVAAKQGLNIPEEMALIAMRLFFIKPGESITL